MLSSKNNKKEKTFEAWLVALVSLYPAKERLKKNYALSKKEGEVLLTFLAEDCDVTKSRNLNEVDRVFGKFPWNIIWIIVAHFA